MIHFWFRPFYVNWYINVLHVLIQTSYLHSYRQAIPSFTFVPFSPYHPALMGGGHHSDEGASLDFLKPELPQRVTSKDNNQKTSCPHV